MVTNNILGTTCTVFLRTAVQVEEIACLSRVRRASNVLDRIRPFIAAAQGELPPEEISARIRELFDSAAAPRAGKVVTGPLNLQ
jgi:hypothetical protein